MLQNLRDFFLGQVYLRGGVIKPALSKLAEGVELSRSADDLPALVSHIFLLGSTMARLKMNDEACQQFIECRDLAKAIGTLFLFLSTSHCLL
jgi:hypothetical protein